MTATKECRGSERDIFNLDFDGFDTHADVENGLGSLFNTLNEAIDSFSKEMKNQGNWNDLTVIVTSDFGR